MAHFTPASALLGGVLLGIAATLLFVLDGRILGISGIVRGVLGGSSSDREWRLLFLAGLMVGSLLLLAFDRAALAHASEQTLPVAVVSGLLVGVGTRASNGCTSGHGLCGLARLSRRSLAATLVFMAAGAVTVFVVRHLLHAGGSS